MGLGFDSHPRDSRRTLVLGGVTFEGEPGLAGHSDGDVVCHALADALLGAAALGDIGQHFPEDDPSTLGVEGPEILRHTRQLLVDAGFEPVACDLVVIADRPHLAADRENIRDTLASALGLGVGAVSVKATRPEGLGLQGDGVGCLALATISSG